MIERLTHADAYGRALSVVPTKPTVAMHRAQIRWEPGAPLSPAHIKVVLRTDDETPCRHFANEAIGWLLARKCGLPVPDRAGFMALPANVLRELHPGPTFAEYSLGWVTATVPESALLRATDMASPALLRELLLWTQAERAASLDEWLGNSDREPRNLLRRAANDYALIDFDYAITGPHWQPQQLWQAREQPRANRLQERLAEAKHHRDDGGRALANALLLHAAGHTEALRQVADDLVEWLPILLEGDALAQLAVAGYVAHRARHAGRLIRTRYGLLT